MTPKPSGEILLDQDRKEELILAKQLRACRVNILPKAARRTFVPKHEHHVAHEPPQPAKTCSNSVTRSENPQGLRYWKQCIGTEEDVQSSTNISSYGEPINDPSIPPWTLPKRLQTKEKICDFENLPKFSVIGPQTDNKCEKRTGVTARVINGKQRNRKEETISYCKNDWASILSTEEKKDSSRSIKKNYLTNSSKTLNVLKFPSPKNVHGEHKTIDKNLDANKHHELFPPFLLARNNCESNKKSTFLNYLSPEKICKSTEKTEKCFTQKFSQKQNIARSGEEHGLSCCHQLPETVKRKFLSEQLSTMSGREVIESLNSLSKEVETEVFNGIWQKFDDQGQEKFMKNAIFSAKSGDLFQSKVEGFFNVLMKETDDAKTQDSFIQLVQKNKDFYQKFKKIMNIIESDCQHGNKDKSFNTDTQNNEIPIDLDLIENLEKPNPNSIDVRSIDGNITNNLTDNWTVKHYEHPFETNETWHIDYENDYSGVERKSSFIDDNLVSNIIYDSGNVDGTTLHNETDKEQNIMDYENYEESTEKNITFDICPDNQLDMVCKEIQETKTEYQNVCGVLERKDSIHDIVDREVKETENKIKNDYKNVCQELTIEESPHNIGDAEDKDTGEKNKTNYENGCGELTSDEPLHNLGEREDKDTGDKTKTDNENVFGELTGEESSQNIVDREDKVTGDNNQTEYENVFGELPSEESSQDIGVIDDRHTGDNTGEGINKSNINDATVGETISESNLLTEYTEETKLNSDITMHEVEYEEYSDSDWEEGEEYEYEYIEQEDDLYHVMTFDGSFSVAIQS